jgi:hypothetical protein
MNEEPIWQMSQKWRFDPKWRPKMRIFYINFESIQHFSIFFLHSFGVGKSIFCKKKIFQKNQDGG